MKERRNGRDRKEEEMIKNVNWQKKVILVNNELIELARH